MYQSVGVSNYSIDLLIYWSIDLSIYLYLSIYIDLSISIFLYSLSIYLYIYKSIVYLSIYPSIYLSTYLFVCLSVYLSIHLSIYLIYSIHIHIHNILSLRLVHNSKSMPGRMNCSKNCKTSDELDSQPPHSAMNLAVAHLSSPMPSNIYIGLIWIFIWIHPLAFQNHPVCGKKTTPTPTMFIRSRCVPSGPVGPWGLSLATWVPAARSTI